MTTKTIQKLSWDVVRDRLAAGAPSILPIGAGCKEHAFHLPLGTDLIQAEWFAEKMSSLCGGLVWPTLSYGYYPSFASYPGSISIAETSFGDIVRDILTGVLAQTCSTVFIVNTGISTIPAITTAVEAMRSPGRVVQIDVYCGLRFIRVRNKVMEGRFGGHADEVETSIMLTIAPCLVDLARAVAPVEGRGHGPGPLCPNDPASLNYSPSGVVGDPLQANADDGRALVAAILEDLANAVRTASRARHHERQKHNNENGEISDES